MDELHGFSSWRSHICFDGMHFEFDRQLGECVPTLLSSTVKVEKLLLSC
jgi:hypothetical protein